MDMDPLTQAWWNAVLNHSRDPKVGTELYAVFYKAHDALKKAVEKDGNLKPDSKEAIGIVRDASNRVLSKNPMGLIKWVPISEDRRAQAVNIYKSVANKFECFPGNFA